MPQEPHGAGRTDEPPAPTRESAAPENSYHQLELSEENYRAGLHREVVGGLWEQMGAHVLDFMVGRRGLNPSHRVLDLGCGCFRCGIPLIRYLERGNYYGLDLNQGLVQAGFRELAGAGLGQRLDPGRVVCNDNFDLSAFEVEFDFILAQSLWTHLTLGSIGRSLEAAARKLGPGGRLLATFFSCPEGHPPSQPHEHQPGGIITYHDRDPYHYQPREFEHLARQRGLPLRMSLVGNWGHPRGQHLVEFLA